MLYEVITMSSNPIERRSFIKLLAAGVGSTLLPIRSLADLPPVVGESAGPVKFKLGKSDWILHSDRITSYNVCYTKLLRDQH